MQSLARLAAILVTATVYLGGCANFAEPSPSGKQMAQVPVTENPSGEIYPGKFIWHDLVTPDARLAGNFYEQLLG